jgi:hypothetical protein
MKIEMDASLLVNILAQLSYQQGFIAGVGQSEGKKFDAMEGFLGDLHCDILRQFEEKKRT